MPNKSKRIAVVGGANVDIGGFPTGTLVMKDSNPGCVRMSAGGVGRNIAENAARLGLNVELVTAIGGDANGRMLQDDCREKKISTENALIFPDRRTSVYLFLGDARGDMHCAINDMDIQLELTPQCMESRMDMLNGMDAVVIDANLPEETIAFLAQNLKVPIFADTVSVAKAGKLRASLDKFYCLKPNAMEAELLSGVQIRDAMDAMEASKRLIGAGMKQIFLTMGTQGALCADERQCVFLPCMARNVVNATGAGDAFMAALVWGYCEGMDLRECGIAGMAAAEIALETLDTVNPNMSRNHLRKRMADIQARM